MSDLIALAGGTFAMGADDEAAFPGDGEGPVRSVTLSPFEIAACATTNQEFARFVGDTGYQTDAEHFGWSFVFAARLPDDFPPTAGVVGAEWWRQVYGADWAHPEGPHTDVDDRGDHPAVHVSWNDAQAYCQWAGRRLPTEAEWEFAARGGQAGTRLPWGDELRPGGVAMSNTFVGDFPVPAPGTTPGTMPADSYQPNGFGLYNVSGNVWEWCADWFDNRHPDGPLVDPTGPADGAARVIKGGSYMCHDSYCNRYRLGARSSNAPDSSTGNMGFRTAR